MLVNVFHFSYFPLIYRFTQHHFLLSTSPFNQEKYDLNNYLITLDLIYFSLLIEQWLDPLFPIIHLLYTLILPKYLPLQFLLWSEPLTW